MNANMLVDRAKLVYPKLSYEIVGILFDVHNELGNRYQEKYYQRAVEVKLRNRIALSIRESLNSGTFD